MLDNHETASSVNKTILNIGKELDESLRLVMDTCGKEEFERYREFVSVIMTTLLMDFMNPLYEKYPDLKPLGLN